MKPILFSGCFNLMFCFILNAQIVYTDVIPDATINSPGGVCHLDLNNDGINDFDISTFSASAGVCSHGNKTNYYTAIVPLNGNEILDNNISFPKALNQNVAIKASSTAWENNATHILTRQYWACIYDQYFHNYHWMSYTNGNFASGAVKYVGLKLYAGTQKYYGWLRMKAGSTSFTIEGYAFDSTPNHKILTGATSGAKIAWEETGFENMSPHPIIIAPNPLSGTASVSWLTTETGVVSLKLFDLNGRYIMTFADHIFEQGEQQVEINVEELNTGIYILRIKSSTLSYTEKIIVTN